MSDASRRVTLADFGDGPRWIANWCLARTDLDGFAIAVRQSDTVAMPCLTVYFYRGTQKVSQAFPMCDIWDVCSLSAKLDRLANQYPAED